MNSQDLINDIPAQAKYQVLGSMVQSINCSLIGTANNIVQRCADSGNDIRELSVTEVENLLTGPDDGDDRVSALEAPRALFRLRRHLVALLDVERSIIEAQDKLRGIKRERPLRDGNLSESLDFMSNPRPVRENAAVDAQLAAIGFTKEQLAELNKEAAVIEAADAARDAEAIRNNQVGIEWVIDHVFNYGSENPEIELENGATEQIEPTFADLPLTVQVSMLDKLRGAVTRTMVRASIALKRGSSLYSSGDLWMLHRIAAECNERVRAIAVAEV